MILSCPVCGTRYRVDERDLGGPAGREVRCANCGHSWHQASPAAETQAGGASPDAEPPRGERALEARARPLPVPRLEAPLRPPPAPPPTSRKSRHRWTAIGWIAAIVVVVLIALAVLAGIAGRRRLSMMWPPAQRFYTAIGVSAEPSGAGLVIGKIAPVRNGDDLMIGGEIANLGNAPRDVPRLRVALQDAAEKEVQSEVVDPPKARLQPGEIVHFATTFLHPADAAAGVVVTFASR